MAAAAAGYGLALPIALSAADAPAPDWKITVDAAAKGPAVSPTLHGVFFEDINYGADGGLYAELVQNRSFEHAESLYSWSVVNRGGDGDVAVLSAEPLNPQNRHYARVTVRVPGRGFGLANSGFGGIAVQRGEKYIVSARLRGASGTAGAVEIALEDETGRVIGKTTLSLSAGSWQPAESTLEASATATHARLVLLLSQPGQVDFDMVSLFPEHTWKNRRNGLRADLVGMLEAMHPAFVRFPGGCIVEGRDLPNRYQWKDSIGDIAERPENFNRWQDAIRGQEAPQYYQTYGLGFYEYFLLCEDLGAEPVPILNCGMACQYQSKQLVPIDQLEPYIQDALDLVEFANGAVTTTWGAKRAAMGHPAPFHLKMMGVGNEQWDEQYFDRYKLFQAALKKRYPEVSLVTTAGPGVDEPRWKLAWEKFRHGTPADIVDEHYYRPPEWFLQNAHRYDHQDRAGPKIFAGEFAAHDGKAKHNTLRAAVAEAAFMTGLLRNSDVVAMSSYAPLFAKAGAWQWAPDLIWFDNTRVYGTPSYHVQALFSRNRPDVVLPVALEPVAPPATLTPVGVGSAPRAAEVSSGTAAAAGRTAALYSAGGRDVKSGEIVLFVANPSAEVQRLRIGVAGGGGPARVAQAWLLTSGSADDENTFEEPSRVAPRAEPILGGDADLSRALPAQSLLVLRLKTNP